MHGDHGHKWAGQQVRPSQGSDPNSVVEPTIFALDVGTTEIKESKTAQDFWLKLPFSQARLCVAVEGGIAVWFGRCLIINVQGT